MLVLPARLRLVSRGLTNAQVAETLVICPLTVRVHLRSIYRKLSSVPRPDPRC